MEGRDDRICAGSVILHVPSGQAMHLLGVKRERNEACVNGWPPALVNISDCKLRLKGYGLKPNERAYRDRVFGSDWDDR